MLRRSSRLRLSGYYLPVDDAAKSGHDGLACRISYRETPARKSWTHRSGTPTLTNELQTPYIKEYSDDGVYDMDMTFDFKAAAQNRDQIVKTESCPNLPCCQSKAYGFQPVYPLTNEHHHSSTLNDSTHDLESRFAFMDVLHSPDLVLAMFCGWLEKTLQTLKQNIFRMQLSYDFKLNGAAVRKTVTIFLIVCLFGGLWYFLPFASPFHWHRSTEILPPYSNTPTTDNSHLSDEILAKMKNEITAVRERETNMMKEITLLKLENEKQKLKFEMFQKDVIMQEMNLKSEYQQQISDLRSDVSDIREVSAVLKQRVETQNPLDTKDVTDIVQSALSLHKSDGIGMADYALESSGGSIIATRCSETHHSKSPQFSLFGIPLWYYSESPQTVIQPEVHPGKCWAFRGSKGFLAISLSHPITITHVTLEHIPKTLSPTRKIDSAPKDFVVYGLSSVVCDRGQLLGSFTYNQDDDPIQTFKLPESTQVYNIVELRILSNWGHPEYTCVYRFRVHGVPWVTNGLM